MAAEKGQIAVGIVPIQGGPCRVDRLDRRPDVGIEILQPQHVRISRRVGGIAHCVNTDTGYVSEP